jgi:hypothetical protein
LAAAHLAVTAETGELRALDEIIDTPLSFIPELPPIHRDYERRRVDRLKVTEENHRNHLKQKQLLLEAWDEVFQTLHACTLRFAPLLHTMMYEACDLRKQGIIGSHFDGPRVWRLLDSRINANERYVLIAIGRASFNRSRWVPPSVCPPATKTAPSPSAAASPSPCTTARYSRYGHSLGYKLSPLEV